MKALIIASALGLAGSAAMADCMGHKPVTASVEVDRTIMTASVQQTTPAKGEEALLLKKTERVPEDVDVDVKE